MQSSISQLRFTILAENKAIQERNYVNIAHCLPKYAMP